MKYYILVLASVFAIAASGCKKNSLFGGLGSNQNQQDGSQSGSNGKDGFNPSEDLKEGNIVWKRYRAFEQGLLAGLELNKAQLCNEMGEFSCIDTVHLTALGGNEPFVSAQHERLEDPSVLTSVAVSRVILSACSQRAQLDEQTGAQGATVFKHFALNASSVDDAAVQAQATELYQRLLARDPTPEEISTITGAKGNFSSPRSFAVAMCYAIGSHIENVFI